MIELWRKLGPGIVFAAMAVGVSHLVQATRTGADYGLSLLWLLLLANIIKFPLFRFACVYSASTGRTLLQGYRSEGRWPVMLLIVSVLIDMVISASAVSIATAGVVKAVTGISAPNVAVVAGLGLVALFIVAASAYRLFERVAVVMVIAFAIITLLSAVMVLPQAFNTPLGLFPPVTLTPGLALFFIAMAGWMPNPPSASFLLSSWSAVRHQSGDGRYGAREATFDFDLGYGLSVLVAISFVLLGAVLLFAQGVQLETRSAAGFADSVLRLLSHSIGEWSYPIVGLAAVFVMFSTMLTIFDGVPRVLRQAVGVREDNRPAVYFIFLLQLFAVLVVVTFFGRTFRSFIDFATSVSFATAPFIAYLNHKVIMRDEVPQEARVGRLMRIWSWAGIVILTGFTIYFFSSKFLGYAH